jgi:hypothetical protein
MAPLIPSERIERRIYLIRGRKVMLSTDLAVLYEVEPRSLVQAVKRNLIRFPPDFMFKLTTKEATASRSQIVTLKRGHNVKHPPYAFTEEGVAMLASVLRSKKAALVNIEILRVFVKLRHLLASHQDLARKLGGLERKCDHRFSLVFDVLGKLMAPPEKPRPRIGFQP